MIKRLEEMDLPNDIKNMDTDELELLAVAIRDFLISNISETGGNQLSGHMLLISSQDESYRMRII